MSYINHKTKTIFLHNPKSGGTYIKNILLDHCGFEALYIEKYKSTDYNLILEKCQHIHHYYPLFNNYLDNYFSFSFVRNPYTKLFSAYNDFKEKCPNNQLLVSFNSFIKNYNKFNNDITFHAFVPQYKHFLINSIAKIKYIAKFEFINTELSNIMNIVGIDENIYKNNTFSINYNHGYYYSIVHSFDNDIISFVNETFKTDFELFNYKMYSNIDEFSSNFIKDNFTNDTCDNSFIYNNIFIDNFEIYKYNSENNLLFYKHIYHKDMDISYIKQKFILLQEYCNTHICDNIIFRCKNCKNFFFNIYAIICHVKYCK